MNLSDILPLQSWDINLDSWEGMKQTFPGISNPIGYKTVYESYEYKIVGFDLNGFREWFFFIGNEYESHNYNKILFNHPPIKILSTITKLYFDDAISGIPIKISFPKRMKSIYQIIVNDLFEKYSNNQYNKKYIENSFNELDAIEIWRK